MAEQISDMNRMKVECKDILGALKEERKSGTSLVPSSHSPGPAAALAQLGAPPPLHRCPQG